MPLPPYIKRDDGPVSSDESDYQTVFAEKPGAVAAPTAGLHFTSELMRSIEESGVKIATVTLHVGAGTFLPVKTDNLAEHNMHSEWCEVSPETVELIRSTKNNGNRVVAVGTTSLRVLESAAKGGEIEPFSGHTDIFIYPPYNFKVVDVLLTNFHLPKSTLLMLISAFSGVDHVRDLYKHAVESKYRFFSYGDACLLFR